MKRISYIFKSVLVASMFSVSSGSACANGPSGSGDAPSVHGMLLFGSQTTYASHLPMFHAPHDYQLILKLTLRDSTAVGVVDRYAASVKVSKDIFTLVPEVMDLTKVIDGSKKTFAGEIYQGHFERGGLSLGFVTVQVEKILLSTKLDTQVMPNENDYFVFGEGGEYFAAHLIRGKPNFDAILVMSEPSVNDSKLPMTLEGPKFSVRAPVVGDEFTAEDGSQIKVSKVIYFESGELAH